MQQQRNLVRTVKLDNEFEWLCYQLWFKKSKSNQQIQFTFSMPDTVILRDGMPKTWYFMSKDGLIHKKNYQNVQSQKITNSFCKKQMQNGALSGQTPAATSYHYKHQRNSQTGDQRVAMMIGYVSVNDMGSYMKASLKQCIEDGSPHVLQGFVPPSKSICNSMIKVQWTQQSIRMLKITNTLPFEEYNFPMQTRTVTCEDQENNNKYVETKKLANSGPINESLIQAVNEIHAHVRMNSNIVINGGNFYFKLDHNDHPVLIFATQIQTVSKVSVLNASANLVLSTQMNRIAGENFMGSRKGAASQDYSARQQRPQNMMVIQNQQSEPQTRTNIQAAAAAEGMVLPNLVNEQVSISQNQQSFQEKALKHASQRNRPIHGREAPINFRVETQCAFCEDEICPSPKHNFELRVDQIMALYSSFEDNPEILQQMPQNSLRSTKFFQDIYAQVVTHKKFELGQGSTYVPEPLRKAFKLRTLADYAELQRNDPTFGQQKIKVCQICIESVKAMLIYLRDNGTKTIESGDQAQHTSSIGHVTDNQVKSNNFFAQSNVELDETSNTYDQMLQQQKYYNNNNDQEQLYTQQANSEYAATPTYTNLGSAVGSQEGNGKKQDLVRAQPIDYGLDDQDRQSIQMAYQKQKMQFSQEKPNRRRVRPISAKPNLASKKKAFDKAVKQTNVVRRPQFNEQEFYNTVGAVTHQMPSRRLVSAKKSVKKASIVDMMQIPQQQAQYMQRDQNLQNRYMDRVKNGDIYIPKNNLAVRPKKNTSSSLVQQQIGLRPSSRRIQNGQQPQKSQIRMISSAQSKSPYNQQPQFYNTSPNRSRQMQNQSVRQGEIIQRQSIDMFQNIPDNNPWVDIVRNVPQSPKQMMLQDRNEREMYGTQQQSAGRSNLNQRTQSHDVTPEQQQQQQIYYQTQGNPYQHQQKQQRYDNQLQQFDGTRGDSFVDSKGAREELQKVDLWNSTIDEIDKQKAAEIIIKHQDDPPKSQTPPRQVEVWHSSVQVKLDTESREQEETDLDSDVEYVVRRNKKTGKLVARIKGRKSEKQPAFVDESPQPMEIEQDKESSRDQQPSALESQKEEIQEVEKIDLITPEVVLIKTLNIQDEIVLDSTIQVEEDDTIVQRENSEIGNESGTGEPRLVTQPSSKNLQSYRDSHQSQNDQVEIEQISSANVVLLNQEETKQQLAKAQELLKRQTSIIQFSDEIQEVNAPVLPLENKFSVDSQFFEYQLQTVLQNIEIADVSPYAQIQVITSEHQEEQVKEVLKRQTSIIQFSDEISGFKAPVLPLENKFSVDSTFFDQGPQTVLQKVEIAEESQYQKPEVIEFQTELPSETQVKEVLKRQTSIIQFSDEISGFKAPVLPQENKISVDSTFFDQGPQTVLQKVEIAEEFQYQKPEVIEFEPQLPSETQVQEVLKRQTSIIQFSDEISGFKASALPLENKFSVDSTFFDQGPQTVLQKVEIAEVSQYQKPEVVELETPQIFGEIQIETTQTVNPDSTAMFGDKPNKVAEKTQDVDMSNLLKQPEQKGQYTQSAIDSINDRVTETESKLLSPQESPKSQQQLLGDKSEPLARAETIKETTSRDSLSQNQEIVKETSLQQPELKGMNLQTDGKNGGYQEVGQEIIEDQDFEIKLQGGTSGQQFERRLTVQEVQDLSSQTFAPGQAEEMLKQQPTEEPSKEQLVFNTKSKKEQVKEFFDLEATPRVPLQQDDVQVADQSIPQQEEPTVSKDKDKAVLQSGIDHMNNLQRIITQTFLSQQLVDVDEKKTSDNNQPAAEEQKEAEAKVDSEDEQYTDDNQSEQEEDYGIEGLEDQMLIRQTSNPFDLEPVIEKIYEKGFTPISLFTYLDENKDEILTHNEIKKGIKALKISLHEWQSLMIAFEIKGDGQITLDEWKEVLVPKLDAEHNKYIKIDSVENQDALSVMAQKTEAPEQEANLENDNQTLKDNAIIVEEKTKVIVEEQKTVIVEEKKTVIAEEVPAGEETKINPITQSVGDAIAEGLQIPQDDTVMDIESCHVDSLDQQKQLIEATANQGKPLILKQCPPCMFIAPLYDEMIQNYPNLVIKDFVLGDKHLKKTRRPLTMPTIVLYVNGVQIDIVKGANRVKMNDLLEKANGLFTKAQSGGADSVANDQEEQPTEEGYTLQSKFIRTVDELDKLVQATAQGAKKPLIVKRCPPCTLLAPIMDDLVKKYPTVVLTSSDIQEPDQEALDKKQIVSMPNFVSYVNGKELERQTSVTRDRLIEMIEKTLQQEDTVAGDKEIAE